jgi:DNA-binding response OmpR family regulator
MKKILVIEDEVQIRENISEILALSGFETLTAETGLQGLELARKHAPDLILCDIMMPELDGLQVLQALRDEASTAMIPVIFLTAKSDHTDVRHGMELGADDYLTKPFAVKELLSAIESRLKRQELMSQHVTQERQKTKQFRQEAHQSQQRFEKSQQMIGLKTDLLAQLSQKLRDPISNINVAIRMLKNAPSDQERDRYLQILQQECDREIQLLNEIEHLQELLTPENTQLLQRFQLLTH